MVKGVEFVTDDSGEKEAVLIDLKRHGEVWEDLYDALRAKERESEPRESLQDVREKVLGRHRTPVYEVVLARPAPARKELQALPETMTERILNKIESPAAKPPCVLRQAFGPHLPLRMKVDKDTLPIAASPQP